MSGLARDEEMQAITNALGAVVAAVARQVDAARLIADLRVAADQYALDGKGPSAGLLDELVRNVESRILHKPGGGAH